MSVLRKKIGLEKLMLDEIVSQEDLKEWLRRACDKLEDMYRRLREAELGTVGAETPNWFIREATAADVTANQARAAGNLIVEHKTNGTKFEFEAS